MLGIQHLRVVVALLAQQPPVGPALRGTVVAVETGQPLAFSIVTLDPQMGKQFTDAAGAFAFEPLSAGRYVLRIRQIGYTPLDTQIVVGDTALRIQIALRHLAIELPPITVPPNRCTKPGPPDSSDPPLLAVFDQLAENARRYELLADSYPFRYTLELSERTVSQKGDSSRPAVRRLEFLSRNASRYAVGGVVGPSYPPWDPGGLVIETGGPDYFANESFVANHCFHLTGRDTLGGGTWVRIDFEPAERVWSADLSGAAYLDTLTYELRYIETALTHPERTDLNGVRSVVARTRFRNIAPGVPLQDTLVVVTKYRFRRSVQVQTQRTVDVRFLHRQPVP